MCRRASDEICDGWDDYSFIEASSVKVDDFAI